MKTYIEPLDNRITGLYCGNINTVISNSKEVRHAYIINQIYNLVLDGINVCVLSFEFSEKQLLYELLCKHSCSSKFGSNFSIKNKPDKELYKAVYEDFKVYINHLKVYDSDDFLVTNVQSIERELIVTENDFIKSTEWGTQVLVVEGIYKMKFDDRNRTLIRRNQIEHEYMLRDLSQNYLGNPGKIAIIVTNSNLEFHDENLYNNTKFNLSHVSENSNNFSDTIVTLRKSEEYRQNNKIEISVLKSANEICCRNEYQFDNF